MDKSTAKKYLEALAWMENPFQELNDLLNNLEGDEREKYKEIVGVIAIGHFDLIMSIINQYPELDPDSEGKQIYSEMKHKYAKKDV